MKRATFTFPLLFAVAAHAADFTGDGRADLLWRAHSGAPVVWQMDGTAVVSRHTLGTALDAGAAIVGAGNFFGSGTGAIAWVDAAHELLLWRVSGGSVLQTCAARTGIDPTWRFLGIGDFSGDGIDDVLWRLSDGSVRVDVMAGCTVAQTLTLPATADPSWTFAGVGRADANGAGALFWRDASGNVIAWRQHNGNNLLSNTFSAGAYASWSIVAAADFDGDGKTDLLWRNGAGTQLAVWLMNGSQHSDAAVTAAAAGVFAAADAIFVGGFDRAAQPAPPFGADWTVAGALDTDGDGDADIALADSNGRVAIWRMQGATVAATGLQPAGGDMPYSAVTGWRLPLARPAVTKRNDTVDVDWQPTSGAPDYVVYASANNDPAATGSAIAGATPPLVYARNDAGFADKRYFAVSASYLGVTTPPSREAYLVEFAPHLVAEWGAMAIADFNGDGCVDLLDALGDCHGNFQLLGENAMGLATLRSNGRMYRDLRYADFDGDGIDDLVSNVYSTLDDANSQARLFRGIDGTHFVEDTAFLALDIRGHGETVVTADFNNDGYLDIFLPNYSMDSPDEHSWLLLNDGTGHFTDVADLTGTASDPDATVALRGVPSNCRVEGAQAVDANGDGRIDLYVASHLFLNQGNDAGGVPHFLDLGPRVESSTFQTGTYLYYNCVVTAPSAAGLPVLHDEGARFIDIDNSGQLALIVDGAESSETGGDGVSLYKFDGLASFSDYSDRIPHLYMDEAWGVQAVDVDNDGLPDIVLSGGCGADYVWTPENWNCIVAGNPHVPPHLLVNRGGTFVEHDFYQDGVDATQVTWFDAPAAADFDLSGTSDVVLRSNSLVPFLNLANDPGALVVSVVGPNGEHNQAGRVVRVTPLTRPDVIMTRIVDGGSGYLANSQYDLAFATPYEGAYSIAVRFANAAYTVTAHRGDHVTLRANGTYSVQ